MNNFHDITLPEFILPNLVSGVKFHNRIVETIAGNEQRRAITNYGRSKYIIRNCKLNLERYEIFHSFFRARQGSLYAFRLRDISDYSLNNVIAVGNGRDVEFPIIKQYADTIAPAMRRILCPDQSNIQIMVEGVDAAHKINNGTVTLRTAPADDEKVSVVCEFDVVVRFNNDELTHQYAQDGTILLDDIELVEVVV